MDLSLAIPFDSLTLRAVAAEIDQACTGGQVQEIRQPSATEISLAVRSHGATVCLLFSCDARLARIHLTSRRTPTLTPPPSFCAALRRHCLNGVIAAVRQADFDRILQVDVDTRGDDGDVTTTTIVAEIMGKHSNLVLVSSEGRIIESAKHVSQRVNRFRQTLPGYDYVQPPAQSGCSSPFSPDASEEFARIITSGSEDAVQSIRGQFCGVSPFLAGQLNRLARESGRMPGDVWKATFQRPTAGAWIALRSGVAAGAYPVRPVLAGDYSVEPCASISEGLDRAFSSASQQDQFAAATAEARAALHKERDRLARRLTDTDRALAEGGKAALFQQTGELILANLWQIEPGAAQVTVVDYHSTDMRERTLELDPQAGPTATADAWFARATKAKAAQANAQQTRERLISLQQSVNALIARLEEAPDAAAARAVLEEARSSGMLSRRVETEVRSTPEFDGHRIRRVVTPENYEILYGETATANDYVTTRLAAANDIWLHVRAATSAHVVIKTQGKPETLPRPVLLEAARICASHSAQKHSSLVSVDYTLRKFVRKPRGAAPGSVDYTREKTIEVSQQ